MAGDGIQNYVDLAAGLTKATRAKATAAAKGLLATAGLEEVAADATDRVAKLTDEVLAASRANRELMGKLIASEVDRAAAVLGFVRAEELDDLRRELSELRMGMAHAAAQTDQTDVTEPVTPALDRPDGALPRQKDRRKEDCREEELPSRRRRPRSCRPAPRRPSRSPPRRPPPRRPRPRSHGEEGARQASARQAARRPGGRRWPIRRGAVSEAVPEKPPVTGDAEIDTAMGEVRQLEELPAADHHEVLGRAHEELHRALQRDPDSSSD